MKYIIDLKNQAINEEATSSDSLDSNSEKEWTEKQNQDLMEPNNKGILEL
jgi:hypothetical protein